MLPFPAGGGDGQGPAGCWDGTGLMGRGVVVVGVVGSLLALFGLGAYTACCPALVLNSYGLQTYRLLSSPLISSGLLSGLFATLSLWQLSQQLEESRGSMWFAHAMMLLFSVTNLVLLVVVILLGALAGSTFFWSLCTVGLWPVVMGMIVIESMQSPDTERRCCCVNIRALYYPWLLFLIFSFISGLDPGLLVGLLLGYLLHYRSEFQLSTAAAQRAEQHPKLQWLVNANGFRSSAAASGVHASAGSAPVGGSSSFVSSSSSIGGGGAAGLSAPPFSGQGHRLGSRGEEVPRAILVPPPAQAEPTGTSVADTVAAPPSYQSAPAAAPPVDVSAIELARRQRAAAYDKRTNKQSGTANASAMSKSNSTFSSALPAQPPSSSVRAPPGGVALPSPPSAPSTASSTQAGGGGSAMIPTIARPPSPSGAEPVDDTAVFTLGLDDDEGTEDDVAAADASEFDPDGELRSTAQRHTALEDDDEQQGFVSGASGSSGGGRRGRHKYAQIGGTTDEPDESLSNAAESASAEPEEDTETTALHASR